MAARPRVIVVGARGVFGSLLVRELAADYDVVPAEREGFDAHGAIAVACTAGPFQQLDRAMVLKAVDAGAHWLDIADDEGWFFDLVNDRALDALAADRGVVVMPGLSTFPAVSGALVRRLSPAKRVTITMRLGNRNRKGAAAIASAAMSGGGALRTPDRELLRRELGIEAEAFVEFEAPGAATMLRLLGRWPKLAAALAKPLRFGTPGAVLEAREGERVVRIETRDQRMAVLPVVFALRRIAALTPGVHVPSVLDVEEMLAFVGNAGVPAG